MGVCVSSKLQVNQFLDCSYQSQGISQSIKPFVFSYGTSTGLITTDLTQTYLNVM